MRDEFTALFVYLQSSPLLGLLATLAAWQLATLAAARLPRAIALPMPIAIALLVAGLLLTGTSYQTYFQGAQYVQVLLGPATVALAVPMHANLPQIRRNAHAIIPAIVAGAVVAAGSAMLLARALGAPREVVLSLAPKSVTTPIAMGIAEQIGGQPALAAVFVLLTGLVAVVLVVPVLRLIRVRAAPARGLAAGTAGHGLATAHMMTEGETAVAFGGIAIGLNGIITALLVPLLVRLF